MRILFRLLATAAATALAAWLLPGIRLTDSDRTDQAITLVAVAALIGLVNAVVRPVVATLTGCLVLITFGLFLLVVNALMLMLVGWLAGTLGLGFEVDGFWTALIGSLIISVVAGAVYGLLHRGRP